MALTLDTSNSATSSGSSSTIAVTLTGVSSGSLIAVFVKHEGASTTITLSDGTDSLIAATYLHHASGGLGGRWFYLISSSATGSVTYTATLGGSRTWKRIYAFEFSKGGGTFELANEAIAESASDDTNPTSPAIAVAANGVGLGGHGEYSLNSESARQIDGVAAGGNEAQGNGSAWYRIISGSWNGVADVTLAGTSRWICGIIGFQEVAAGGATTSIHHILNQ